MNLYSILRATFIASLVTVSAVSCSGDDEAAPAQPIVNEGVVKEAEAVDLGLSVKWASWNLGTSKPEGCGDYFAWGEVRTKSSYAWKSYKWSDGSSDWITKYCTNEEEGEVDNNIFLDKTDDAAHFWWGKEWFIPTKAQFNELIKKCTWKWTKLNGVAGYRVTGPNGNSIFLPTTGLYHSEYHYDEFGSYWTSLLDDDGMNIYSYSILLEKERIMITRGVRYMGMPIRPVCY